jgi:hypothetical protein
MSWQLALVALIVAAAAWYLFHRTWRTWIATRANCTGSCGCSRPDSSAAGESPASTLIPPEEVALRPRRQGP